MYSTFSGGSRRTERSKRLNSLVANRRLTKVQIPQLCEPADRLQSFVIEPLAGQGQSIELGQFSQTPAKPVGIARVIGIGHDNMLAEVQPNVAFFPLD